MMPNYVDPLILSTSVLGVACIGSDCRLVISNRTIERFACIGSACISVYWCVHIYSLVWSLILRSILISSTFFAWCKRQHLTPKFMHLF